MAVASAGTARGPRRDGPGSLTRFVGVAAAGTAVVSLSTAALGLPAPAIVLATAAFAVAAAVFAVLLPGGHAHRRLGWANVVTCVRMVILAVLFAMLVAGAARPLLVIVLGAVALALDGVDGLIARRQGTASVFGAMFDMEVDAAFGLVLAALAAAGPAGPLALILGVPRYLFGIAATFLPWLDAPLDDRFSRKAVCVVQLVALLVLQVPALPVWTAMTVVAVTAGALVWSFGVDVRTLHRRRSAT